MIQFEEEIKKFYKSPEVGDVEDVIYNRDMTDATDLLFQIMQQQDSRSNRNNRQEKKYEVLSLWCHTDTA